MAKSKYTLKSGPFSFVFWPEISTSLRDPLGCSDLSQIFFGSSPTATEWDKIVAEIIHKTFVFLRHPRPMCMGAPTQIRLNFVMRPYFSMFFSFHFLNFVQKHFLTDVTHGKKHIQMKYNYIFHCLWKYENHFPSGLLTQGSARP